MKKRLHSTILALAVVLLGTAAIAPAQTLTPGKFNRELQEEIKSLKTPAQRYARAAVLLQQALQNRNNRRFAVQYTNFVARTLAKPSVVPIPLQGRAFNTVIKALTGTYFKGTAFNLNDARYTQALSSLLRGLKLPQRTEATATLFYNSIRVEGQKRGVPVSVIYEYVAALEIRFRYPTPVS